MWDTMEVIGNHKWAFDCPYVLLYFDPGWGWKQHAQNVFLVSKIKLITAEIDVRYKINVQKCVMRAPLNAEIMKVRIEMIAERRQFCITFDRRQMPASL